MTKRKISYLIDTVYLCIVIFIAFIIKPFLKEDIYLIGERKDQCQDNGYHLFKYVRTKHPEEKFFYVIEKNAQQLLSELINLINQKHFTEYKEKIEVFFPLNDRQNYLRTYHDNKLGDLCDET